MHLGKKVASFGGGPQTRCLGVPKESGVVELVSRKSVQRASAGSSSSAGGSLRGPKMELEIKTAMGPGLFSNMDGAFHEGSLVKWDSIIGSSLISCWSVKTL